MEPRLLFASTVSLQAIAAPGRPVPIAPTEVFVDVGRPVINDAGQIVLTASLRDTTEPGSAAEQVLMAGSAFNLQVVTREGLTFAELGPNVAFAGLAGDVAPFAVVGLGRTGGIAFTGRLTGSAVTADSDEALLYRGPSGVQLVAREGQTTGAGATFDAFDDAVGVDEQGRLAFLATVDSDDADVGLLDALFAGAPGATAGVAVEGNAAPVGEAGAAYGAIRAPAVAPLGRVAFVAELEGDDVDPAAAEALFAGPGDDPSMVALVARAGQAAPGAGPGVVYAQSQGSVFSDPSVNGAGLIAFRAGLGALGATTPTADGAVYVGTAGALQIAARHGAAAPGTGATYDLSGPLVAGPVLNAQSRVAFAAKLGGAGVTAANDQAIFAGPASALELVAREGAAAPGAGGAAFGELASPIHASSTGQLVFVTKLTGAGVTAANDTALWTTDPDGNLLLAARTGGQLEFAPGDVRTVSALSIGGAAQGAGGEDGRSRVVDDFGRLVFQAEAPNGDAAAVVATVTETPPTAGPDFTADVVTQLPASAVGGARGKVTVVVTNDGTDPYAGPLSVALVASPDDALDAGDVPLATLDRDVRLNPGRSKRLTFKFAYPETIAADDYRVLADVDPADAVTETDETNNVGVSETAIGLAPALRDLTVAFTGTIPASLAPAGRGVVTVTVQNTGNTPVTVPVTVGLAIAPADPAQAPQSPPTDAQLGTRVATRGLRPKVAPGRARVVRFRFALPAGLAAGTYRLTAKVDTGNAVQEPDEANNNAITAGTIAVTAG